MSRTTRRVLASFVAVLVIAGAATSAFAYTAGYTPSNPTTNPGPTNAGVAVSPTSVTPGNMTSITANYTFPISANSGFVSLAAGTNYQPGATTIGTMWQQVRYDQDSQLWAYLYAANQAITAGVTAAQSTVPYWNYYYYTKNQGQAQFATTQGGAGSATGGVGNGVFASLQNGVTGIVYEGAGSTLPAFTIIQMVANSSTCATGAQNGGATLANRCPVSFSSQIRWGVAQNAFNPGTSGSASILEAVESVPISGVTYVDPWSNAATLTLTNAKPTVTSVSNVGTSTTPVARSAGTSYPILQTNADTNGDLQTGSLVFVITSGTQSGQWFEIGWVNTDNKDNTITTTTGNAFYRSWNETVVFSPGTGAASSPMTANYVSSFTAAGGGTATTETITYAVTFSTAARGSVSVYGTAGDYHGGGSGNVAVGSLTIS